MKTDDVIRIDDGVLRQHPDIACVVRGLDPARPDDEEALVCGSEEVLRTVDAEHKRRVRIWDVSGGTRHEVDPVSGRRYEDRFRP